MALKVVICCLVNLYAEGLRRLLEEDEGIHILGIAHDGREIQNLVQYNPDVIITDLSSCKETLRILSPNGRKNVLLVDEGSNIGADDIKSFIAEGLGGIVAINADAKLLLKAIRKIHDGELWFDRQTIGDVLSHKDEKKKSVSLTKKETEILDFICIGLTNKEIANKLFISEQTVKSHCNHLFKKFGVSSRLKLAVRSPNYDTHKPEPESNHLSH